MNKRILLLPLIFAFVKCDFGPAPLKLGQAANVDAQGELTIPLNVAKAFSPTGYFYNVWAPADTTFTQVDPEKWNNFLAYQSIFLHPACKDRVPYDTLVKYDSTLPAYISPSRFYDEFECTQFTYAPASSDDIYGGVFWLRNNNFGNHPGTMIHGGAKKVRFWAKSFGHDQSVKFGVGVNNSSTLKPWYYFSPYVDEWGKLDPTKTALFEKKPIFNPATGKTVDSVVVTDSLPEGAGMYELMNLTQEWTMYELDLGILYAFNNRPDTVHVTPDSIQVNMVPFNSIPSCRLIGAFFWAIDKNFISDSSHVTPPIVLPDGTQRKVKYGSATILIDGIRYE